MYLMFNLCVLQFRYHNQSPMNIHQLYIKLHFNCTDTHNLSSFYSVALFINKRFVRTPLIFYTWQYLK